MKNNIIVMFVFVACGVFAACTQSGSTSQQNIDRKAVVDRHKVMVSSFDTLSSLTVGNGGFAFTADATGLQSFPDAYAKGVVLGTQSDWGWHSFPNIENYKVEEAYKTYQTYGRDINYLVQWKTKDRKEDAGDYFRVNPHRLHLGLTGLEMNHADGTLVKMNEITDIKQSLDLWKGIIISQFKVDGELVEVETVCHPESDVVSAKVKSSLIKRGLLSVKLSFPYPTGSHTDYGYDWNSAEKHQSKLLTNGDRSAVVERQLDSTRYYVNVSWEDDAAFVEKGSHVYELKSTTAESIAFSVRFSSENKSIEVPTYEQTCSASMQAWEKFWMTGGAVDFAGSTDVRAKELERRIVLSQYLTRVQCAGIYPPQETGLTFNSWFGKYHLEMDWWHGAHFALWNRIDLLEKRLTWYHSVYDVAQAKAKRQGYKGARWGKMTDPSGGDSPSSIGEMLIWQQPHIIYFSELCYRHYKDTATLKKYSDLVFATADFMASYAHFDEVTNRYVLGPNVIPAQECFKPETTINPPFELAYWRFALQTALNWQKRMGLPENEEWRKVLNGLSPLAFDGDKYLVAESSTDTYTNPEWLKDHPMVLGAFGLMPGTASLDTVKMGTTFDYLLKNWDWAHTWGWDYPMVAMSATRLGKPNQAIDALLMDVQKNTYLNNGHNFQDKRLRIYLPGNGGILSAVAMMCAGYDGCTVENPGFPKDGSWVVKWENLAVMP